ncbi:biopolymer transporter ExbD [Rhodoferax saidenbachensis]|uniref:Biopolymer transport protein TolR n=1 Tax=Rhodoferax saidenbachensis TaxID=1484693 RepID=A0ABU1ZL83_9BURK|nr:biopolymer transporter ExbD [Rhodoferax saidenbachensis]MDR7306297.1 biopolymer transport protein TolR [Rhodoferax saidenbachensis]
MSFGRLERTPGAKPMSEINMTPLIDVMLVLLVIFIITAPLLVSAVKVDLPQAEGAQAADAPKYLSVVIDKTGQIFLADQPTPPHVLAQAFQTAATQNPLTEVQLRADTTVPYGRVVEVMGLAQKAGLNRIGFVAEPESPSTPASASN